MLTVFRAGAINCRRLLGRKHQVRRPFGVRAMILALCIAPVLLFSELAPVLVGQVQANDQSTVFYQLAANATGSAQVNSADLEKFNRGLDELNRKMWPRPTKPIEWDVTELLRPFLPNCVTVEDAINAFKSLGFRPYQDKVGKRYLISIRVEYDRLSAQGRTRFLSGDWLVIGYYAEGIEEEVPLTDFKAVLLNDSIL